MVDRLSGIEVVYIPLNQVVFRGVLPYREDLTVSQVLVESGVHDKHPETKTLPVGLFSEKVSGDKVLQPGDRLEIYRPLLIEPKEKRRLLARKK